MSTAAVPASLDLRAWTEFCLACPSEIWRLLALDEIRASGDPRPYRARLTAIADADPSQPCRDGAHQLLDLGNAMDAMAALPPLDWRPGAMDRWFGRVGPAARTVVLRRKPGPVEPEVLDAWRTALREDPDRPAAAVGIALLGRAGNADDAPLIGRHLRRRDAEVVVTAIDALATVSPATLTRVLPALIRRPDLAIRFHAIRRLRAIDPGEATEFLAHFIADDDPFVRQHAMRELLLVPFEDGGELVFRFFGREDCPLLLVLAGIYLASNPHPDSPLRIYDVFIASQGVKKAVMQLIVNQFLMSIRAAGILSEPADRYLANLTARLQERRTRVLVEIGLRELSDPDPDLRAHGIDRLAAFLGRPEVMAALQSRQRQETEPELLARLETLLATGPAPHLSLAKLAALAPDAPATDATIRAAAAPAATAKPAVSEAPAPAAPPADPTTPASPAASPVGRHDEAMSPRPPIAAGAPATKPPLEPVGAQAAHASPDLRATAPQLPAAPPTPDLATTRSGPSTAAVPANAIVTTTAGSATPAGRGPTFLEMSLLQQHRLLATVQCRDDYLKVRPMLLGLLRASLPKSTRLRIIQLIGAHGDRSDADRLQPMLTDMPPAIVAAVLAALSRIDVERTMCFIKPFLNHEHYQVRARALESLIGYDKEAALNHLRQMLQSPSDQHRRQAVTLLHLLDAAAAEPLAIDVVRREQRLEIKREAALVLAMNPSVANLRMLHSALHDRHGQPVAGLADLWSQALQAAQLALGRDAGVLERLAVAPTPPPPSPGRRSARLNPAPERAPRAPGRRDRTATVIAVRNRLQQVPATETPPAPIGTLDTQEASSSQHPPAVGQPPGPAPDPTPPGPPPPGPSPATSAPSTPVSPAPLPPGARRTRLAPWSFRQVAPRLRPARKPAVKADEPGWGRAFLDTLRGWSGLGLVVALLSFLAG